jgi:hypothetical protein
MVEPFVICLLSANFVLSFGNSVDTLSEWSIGAQSGAFFWQLVDPKTGDEKKVTITEDDGIRPNASLADLSKLKTVFKKSGTTTAGMSLDLSFFLLIVFWVWVALSCVGFKMFQFVVNVKSVFYVLIEFVPSMVILEFILAAEI